MKRTASILLTALVVCLLAPPAFAQAADPAATSGVNWKILGTAAGMAIAAAFCGLAQSKVASAACEGIARNPGAAGDIRGAMILGLVFIETLVLFTLAMIYLNA